MIWWRNHAQFKKNAARIYPAKTGQIKAYLGSNSRTHFTRDRQAHSAILFGSPCTRGSQQLKNVFSVIKKGRDHGNEVTP